MTCIVENYSAQLSSFVGELRTVPLTAESAPLPYKRESEENKSSRQQQRRHSCSNLTDTKKAPRPPQAWWEGQLAEGIHRTMRNREKMLDTIKLASPQLQKRVCVVDFMINICRYLPLSDTTRHLAVLLLDHFMEKHSIMDFRLKLVALTCLLIAAKMEDRDDHLPTIRHLQILAKLENLADYSRENFQKMELYLMKFFNWSVSYPTAIHFIGYYNANHSLLLEELDNGNDLYIPPCLDDMSIPEADFLEELSAAELNLETNSECNKLDLGTPPLPLPPVPQCGHGDFISLHSQLEEITASLLEKALRDYRFLQYSPSMVAAGSLYVARRYISVTPTWTSRLESVSGYSKELLEPVIKLFEDCNSIA